LEDLFQTPNQDLPKNERFFSWLLNFVSPDHQVSRNPPTFRIFHAFAMADVPFDANRASVVTKMTVVTVHDCEKSESLRIANVQFGFSCEKKCVEISFFLSANHVLAY
jgi:hypothetical protein